MDKSFFVRKFFEMLSRFFSAQTFFQAGWLLCSIENVGRKINFSLLASTAAANNIGEDNIVHALRH